MTTISEYTISLPFQITASGKVQDTSDQTKIWMDRVLSVLGTGWGERLLRYEFGTKIHKENFSTISGAEAAIKLEVSNAFEKFLSILELTEVTTEYREITNELYVAVSYKLPNQTEVTQVIGSVFIRGNQPPKER